MADEGASGPAAWPRRLSLENGISVCTSIKGTSPDGPRVGPQANVTEVIRAEPSPGRSVLLLTQRH